ncbi:MAG: mycothiol synthase [Propionibacteriaceae bacterium]|jgi:mycothiol synthase|nr:mycothiol synthase [Propionibacteriaceae bacterium]
MTKLSADQVSGVLAIAERAQRADGSYPLNEAALSGLQADLPHYVRQVDGELAAYLQYDPRYDSAQLVVDPQYRRQGLATALLKRAGRVPVWAFHDIPAAQGLAERVGYLPGRSLLVMAADIDELKRPREIPEPTTPRLGVRPYRPSDLAELVAVNAAAFAHHPEQGQQTASDFQALMAEEWFDPTGLLLGFDGDALVGFHWTKLHDKLNGEVYVLGVAPTAQGKGYGRALLTAGIEHLGETGVDSVFLYVDEAEKKPVKLYKLAGFKTAHQDVLYLPQEKLSRDYEQ